MLKNKPYQYSFIWDGIYINQMLLRIHFEIVSFECLFSVYAIKMSVTELCLTLEIPECQAVGHTSVTFPNVFNHYSIEDAMSYFNSFKGKSCSASSMYFLCNILFPKCDPATGRMTYACQDHCNGRYNIPFLLSFFLFFFFYIFLSWRWERGGGEYMGLV